MNSTQKTSKEEVKPKPTIEEINDAFFFLEDMFSRALMPWVTLGETARAIINTNPTLMENGIDVGVKEKDMTRFGRGVLEIILQGYKPEGMPRLWKFDYKGIPITIRVIYRNWPFFESYDKKVYYFEHIPVPNPFLEYWKKKDLIV